MVIFIVCMVFVRLEQNKNKNKKKQQTNKTNKLESQKTLCLINT